jgi:hypothetical protein
LLARLMPKQRTAGISADGATQKRPSQQRPLGHPPRALLRTDLVKTEQHERPQINQRKQAKGVGEGEEVREGHEGLLVAVNKFIRHIVAIAGTSVRTINTQRSKGLIAWLFSANDVR